MRKLMLMTAAAAMCAVAGLAAEPKFDCLARASLASFADIKQKVDLLGRTINNPVVPMLVLGGAQQALAQQFGSLRSDSPVYCYVYGDVPDMSARLDEALQSKPGRSSSSDAPLAVVVVYPSVDGIAKMQLGHPGSTKEADGTLHLLPNAENNAGDRWVAFSEDGRYCAISDKSAAWSKRAIADFRKDAAARAAAAREGELLRLDVFEPGLKALSLPLKALCSEKIKAELTKQMARSANIKNNVSKETYDQMSQAYQAFVFDSFDACRTVVEGTATAVVAIDLNDRGLSFDVRTTARPGAKPPAGAPRPLAAGALDQIPAGAYLTVGGGVDVASAAKTKELALSCWKFVQNTWKEQGLPAARKKAKGRDLESVALFDDVLHQVGELIQSSPLPKTGDWAVASLGFDSARRPYFATAGELSGAEQSQASAKAFVDKFAASVKAHCESCKSPLTMDASGTLVVDWRAAIDLMAYLGKHEASFPEAEAIVSGVLGGFRLVCSNKVSGRHVTSLTAGDGVKLPSARPDGEAALAAALPEAKGERPADVCSVRVYALMREIVLPVLLAVPDVLDEEKTALCKTLQETLPPEAPASCCVSASWKRGDGSGRYIFRLTTGEIRNIGAAVNAYMAAAVKASSDKDDE